MTRLLVQTRGAGMTTSTVGPTVHGSVALPETPAASSATSSTTAMVTLAAATWMVVRLVRLLVRWWVAGWLVMWLVGLVGWLLLVGLVTDLGLEVSQSLGDLL